MLRNGIIAALVVVALVVVTGAYSFLRAPAPASEPIQAIPIAAAPTLAATATQPPAPTATAEPEPTVVTTEATAPAAEATATEAAPEPTSTPPPAPTETPTVAPSAPTLFEIQQEGSQARFTIDEVLRGAPFTVVGATNQVAGQISVDTANPANTQIGPIQINARTFATDSGNRDRAIQNYILTTSQYEYITFVPTTLSGLPDTAAVGQPYQFTVTGPLTIRDVTRDATFTVNVTAPSEDRLEGNASTTIRYGDWGITIPSVPFVASVAEELQLQLDFVALPQ